MSRNRDLHGEGTSPQSSHRNQGINGHIPTLDSTPAGTVNPTDEVPLLAALEYEAASLRLIPPFLGFPAQVLDQSYLPEFPPDLVPPEAFNMQSEQVFLDYWEDELDEPDVGMETDQIETGPVNFSEIDDDHVETGLSIQPVPLRVISQPRVDRELLVFNEEHRVAMRAFFASLPKKQLSGEEVAKERMLIYIDGVEIRVHRGIFLDYCISLKSSSKKSEDELKKKPNLSFRIDFECNASDFARFATFIYEGRTKVLESRIEKFLNLCIGMRCLAVFPANELRRLKLAVAHQMELPDAIDVNNIQAVLGKH